MKKRLDVLIFEKGLAKSRSEAERLIMSGLVLIDGKVFDKPGMSVAEDVEVVLKEKFPYVSRGALKLEKAFQEFSLNFKDKIICDVGSSTGGFTDFALQNGAKKVYAVDVGRGQLDQKIREDQRVVVMERTDFRDVNEFDDRIDMFVCDVSFISLKKILPKIKQLSEPVTSVIALIKPQFEVGKAIADRFKGVIKDEDIRQGVVKDIENFSRELGFEVKGITESPIEGAKGNKEYLMYLIPNY